MGIAMLSVPPSTLRLLHSNTTQADPIDWAWFWIYPCFTYLDDRVCQRYSHRSFHRCYRPLLAYSSPHLQKRICPSVLYAIPLDTSSRFLIYSCEDFVRNWSAQHGAMWWLGKDTYGEFKHDTYQHSRRRKLRSSVWLPYWSPNYWRQQEA